MRIPTRHLVFASFLLHGPFLLGSLYPTYSQQEKREPTTGPSLIVGVGEQRLVRLPRMTRYSIGNSAVRAIPIRGKNSLLIKGIRRASTNLWVWNRDGSIEIRPIKVIAWKMKPTQERLLFSLRTLSEVEVIPYENGAILRGEVRTLSEALKIQSLSDLHEKSLLNATTPSPKLLDQIEKEVKRKLRYLPTLRSIRESDRILIEGHYKGEPPPISKMPFTLWRAKSLSSEGPTIYLEVIIVAIQKSTIERLGIEWPARIPFQLKAVNHQWESSSEFQISLETLQSDGKAEVLSRPQLVVRAPGKASLFAGTEFPIKTKTQYQQQIQWKKFGLILNIDLKEATASEIRIDIETETSYPIGSLGDPELPPSIRANRMKTQVDSTYGFPLLLSGLVHEDARRTDAGVAYLREIPFLGALFGKSSEEINQIEILTVIIPHRNIPPPPNRLLPLPSGPLPPPRNWLSPNEIRELKKDPDYPWNVF